MTRRRRDGAATTLLQDLIGSRVFDAGRRSVGRVIDLEVARTEDWTVTAILVGRLGLLDRLATLRGIEHALHRIGSRGRVEWRDVASWTADGVRLRRGATVGELSADERAREREKR